MEEQEDNERAAIAAAEAATAALTAVESATEKVERLAAEVRRLDERLLKAERYMPSKAVQFARAVRFWYEAAGVGVAATGAWWVYPPAALLLIGGWMMWDVLALRKAAPKAKE